MLHLDTVRGTIFNVLRNNWDEKFLGSSQVLTILKMSMELGIDDNQLIVENFNKGVQRSLKETNNKDTKTLIKLISQIVDFWKISGSIDTGLYKSIRTYLES